MFDKKIEVVSNKATPDLTDNFRAYIEKKVYSKTGELVGYVYDVIIKNDCLIGVMYKGSNDSRVFIGKEFFKSDTKEAIMLSIEPVTALLGKQVYDSTGKYLGKVVELKRDGNSNTYDELRVKKSFFYKSVYIPKHKIDVAKKSVILKEPWEQK